MSDQPILAPEERADDILDSGPLVFGTADHAHYREEIAEAIRQAVSDAIHSLVGVPRNSK